MASSAEPTTAEMEVELLAAGWKRLRACQWESPSGALFLGPYQAWRVIKGVYYANGK